MFFITTYKTLSATIRVITIHTRATHNAVNPISTTTKTGRPSTYPLAFESAVPREATNDGFKSKFAKTIQEGNKANRENAGQEGKGKMSKIAKELEEYDAREMAKEKLKEGEQGGEVKKGEEGKGEGMDKVVDGGVKGVGKVKGCNGGCVKCKCGKKA